MVDLDAEFQPLILAYNSTPGKENLPFSLNPLQLYSLTLFQYICPTHDYSNMIRYHSNTTLDITRDKTRDKTRDTTHDTPELTKP